MKLEICASSYQSAKNAQEAGAHRIELCQELSVGGVTPSFGLLKQVIKHLKIPVFVLIRPRGGNFVYSDPEFEIMKTDIQLCKDEGCAGVVSGILNADKTIDLKRTKELIELSKPLQFTFHRAFDEVINPKKALEQLIYLGVERVLTSGQKASAIAGLEVLIDLNKQSKGRIVVLIGSGISAENASVFKAAGFKEIHASASSALKEEDSLFAMPLTYSDPIKIKAILDAI
jgi:copper homeostasis protein